MDQQLNRRTVMELDKQQGQAGIQGAGQMLGNGLSASQYAAARESAQTIVASMVDRHSQELAGWAWLKTAMEKHPPSKHEETALWDIVTRARRERY
jgi:hypothetical protein